MPIFEFVCRACERPFEALVSRAEEAECPSCRGRELQRRFSVFAVGGRGPSLAAREPAGPCGTCGDPRGPGSCALKR